MNDEKLKPFLIEHDGWTFVFSFSVQNSILNYSIGHKCDKSKYINWHPSSCRTANFDQLAIVHCLTCNENLKNLNYFKAIIHLYT